jgi:type IV pilus assembly protein PilA
MYFALMGKLSARRQNLAEDKDKGFTLIELLVVVIIIGILAAIAIPVYLGVQNNAKDSGVKSDLTNFKTAIISVQTNAGKYPAGATYSATAALSDDLVKAGATLGTDTSSLKYTVDNATAPTKFCAEGLSSTGNKFTVTDLAGVAKGTCNAGVASGS